MEVVAKSNSRRMYSWWWDSHNTPKNSKWLQENLADMDSNVKKMIKVLEEDADSFARRAEMYYRKRPELMKLVEEFYRQYRALAERYNHAAGVIHKAHQTIAEVFPNQVPLIFDDKSHVGALVNDVDPQTPEMSPHFRDQVDTDELQKDILGFSLSHNFHDVKRHIDFNEEPPFVRDRKARRGLDFNDRDGKERSDLTEQILSESERATKAEAEVVALKESLSKLQAEKEAKLAQFENNLDRLSNLESEISRAEEDSGGLNDKAANAEAEIQTLRETIDKLDSEKESCLYWYQQCLQKIADLEDGINVAHKDAGESNERASKAEAETLALKQSLAEFETDKEAALVQYRQCLKTISNLEDRLRKTEEDAKLINERAGKAAVEVENLKQTISKLVEDKEASELQYQQCLNIIADLKLKLYNAQEETQRLNCEVEDRVSKLKFSEEKCLVLERSNQNLHSELDNLLEKLGNQSQKLTEKQTELVKLLSHVQEEHLHFQESETAIQIQQRLHSQSQEELNNLAVELQTSSQIMKYMEICNNGLHKEIQQAKVENIVLIELLRQVNSEAVSITTEKNLKDAETENLQLKRNLLSIRSDKDQLEDEISNFKDQLREKEKELEEIKVKQEKLNHEIFKERKEVELWESQAGTLFCDKQISAVHETLIESSTQELAKTRKNHESSQTIGLLNENIKSLEEYVFARRESGEDLSKDTESMDEFPKLEDMCLRIKAITEAIKEKEKLLILENSNANTMLEAALKQIKELKTGGERSMRKSKEVGKMRKHSNEIEMITKDIVLDQTSDGSSYEILSKRGTLDVELKPVKTRKTETAVKTRRGKSLSEETAVKTRKSKILSEETAVLTGNGKYLSEETVVLTGKSKSLSEETAVLTEEGKSLSEETVVLTGEEGKSLTEETVVLTGNGKSLSEETVVLTGEGKYLSAVLTGKGKYLSEEIEVLTGKGKYLSEETKTGKGKSLSEECLIVERLEIFDGFMDPNREVNKMKVLERLDSDLKKLENLQITIEDLKRKVETEENEYETIKEQLKEAEEGLEKLFNVNRKLKSKAELEKDSNRRRRISEQARRGSEKIGRLQLDLQRMQFSLMKLEGDKENRDKLKISDTKSKVYLRDYIYGGGSRSVLMKKKMIKKKPSLFCGCVQKPLSP